MLDIMYEVPLGETGHREVVINEETIQKGAQPLMIYQKSGERLPRRRGLTGSRLRKQLVREVRQCSHRPRAESHAGLGVLPVLMVRLSISTRSLRDLPLCLSPMAASSLQAIPGPNRRGT